MLVKDLIQALQQLPEHLPVYYIDDGAYVEVNKLVPTELSNTKWNILLPTRYSKQNPGLDVLVGKAFDALVLDHEFFKQGTKD
jgi:hypothetical protein